MIRAFVFPGQGSQKKGMGEDLFDRFPEITSKADRLLGYSIKELCLEDPKNILNLTQYTQPALYIVNALMYFKKLEGSSERPDYIAGHSLGEYSALLAAGAFDFETGLKLVQKRAVIMSQAAGGGMAAVIGLTEEKIRDVLEEKGLTRIDIANYNSPFQTVISGPREDINQAKETFEDADAKLYIPLKVSGAFHSRYMETAGNEFGQFLENFEFSDLTIPVISNVEARPYTKEKIKQLLADQMTHSVKWTESIRYLMGKGVEEFEEIGPGRVLTGLIQKIQKEAAPLIISENDDSSNSGEGDQTEHKDVKPQGENDHDLKISPFSLGSQEFREDFHIRYAYIAGSMYKGISSKELVVRMGKAGLMGFLGTGGLAVDQIEASLRYIQNALPNGGVYGVNLLNNIENPELENQTVDLFLRYGVRNVEASAYMQMTPGLVLYRLNGIHKNGNGDISAPNRVIAKVSRPEVADYFMSPPPEPILNKLVQAGKLSSEEAELGRTIPMSEYICVEADSGGHTDQGVAFALYPAIVSLRNEKMKKYGYKKKIRVGLAGGIGTPLAASAAFIMGADFILTGSINQCTVEAGISDSVKDMLQDINVQDTAYAPAGDMFEIGAKVQVLRKGVFFPARANKLYEIYRQYNALNEIDEKTRKQIQEKYFRKSFEEVWQETEAFYSKVAPDEITKAMKSPKHKMALTFRWYFGRGTWLALNGIEDLKVDYQVQCGPALGAFNQWVKGTEMENWRNRHVDEIAEKLMEETALPLRERLKSFGRNGHRG